MEVPLQSAPSGAISPCIRNKDHIARQAIRIKEIGAALAADGFVTVDEQARALGLSRSSAWAVLKADHKASGLTVPTINRMLSSPELPPRARVTILTYIEEKFAGLYGNKEQLDRAIAATRPANPDGPASLRAKGKKRPGPLLKIQDTDPWGFLLLIAFAGNVLVATIAWIIVWLVH
jgi:predicted DNA-binding transcriptional regulator AlpA